MSTPLDVDHFFRHEYGKMVSIITHKLGVYNLELVEDAVQTALLKALDLFTKDEAPKNPSPWIYKVAFNEAMSVIRKDSNRKRILAQYANGIVQEEQYSEYLFSEHAVSDVLLRMLFICCDQSIPEKSQLVLALKTLCGFGVQEIGFHLFISEDNVYKRLSRARMLLKKDNTTPEDLTLEEYSPRLSGVHRVLYSMFTEGYLSTKSELSMRLEICDEAMRLTSILVEHTFCQTPESHALLALMYFHRARMKSRQDPYRGLILLEEQDRKSWDRGKIEMGLHHLALSAKGDLFSRYHGEAAIAADHCLSQTYGETPWKKIIESYELLEKLTPSPLYWLNRAVATSEWKGAKAGLKVLKEFDAPPWLTSSYLWVALLAYLYKGSEYKEKAIIYYKKALELAPTKAIKELLEYRLKK